MRNPTMYTLQETIEWAEFESICVDYLFLNGYKKIRQAGKVRDNGRDAVVMEIIAAVPNTA